MVFECWCRMTFLLACLNSLSMRSLCHCCMPYDVLLSPYMSSLRPDSAMRLPMMASACILDMPRLLVKYSYASRCLPTTPPSFLMLVLYLFPFHVNSLRPLFLASLKASPLVVEIESCSSRSFFIPRIASTIVLSFYQHYPKHKIDLSNLIRSFCFYKFLLYLMELQSIYKWIRIIRIWIF